MKQKSELQVGFTIHFHYFSKKKKKSLNFGGKRFPQKCSMQAVWGKK